MEKKKCKRCKKVIEGYNTKHVDFLMKQHELSAACIAARGRSKACIAAK